ncbi:MAG: cytidine deaminase [Sphingomonadaceae bacterium]
MELDAATIGRLREAAQAAAERAYAPYSRFRVGAAVLTEDGEVFGGCNVECASYSLTICAERNAIFHAVAAGHRKVAAVAIYTPTADPTPPCGACRQVLSEFGPEAEILSFSEGGAEFRAHLGDLLPHSFGPRDLK